MVRVVNSIAIAGEVGQVFDVVTTARYWPQWHPATVGVDGATEQPMQLGDVIYERARIGDRVYEGAWSVVEHVRPSRVVLRGPGGRIQITYAFQGNGASTWFTRELAFHPEDFASSAADPEAVEALMHRQSEEALRKLKQLVENHVHGA